MRAAFGRGFRAPDLGQLYYRFLNPTSVYQVIGNPLLRPESSSSWQYGFDVRRGSRARVELNLFHNDVRNLIESANLGFIATAGQLAAIAAAERIDPDFSVQLNRLLFFYKNITHARTQGAELEGDLRLHSDIRLSGSYAFLDAVNAATKVPLTDRSTHHGTVRIDWTPLPIGLRANLRGTFYSPWIVSVAQSAAGPVSTRAAKFALWDLTLAKSLTRGAELFGAIENLTDSQDPNTGMISTTNMALPIYRPEIGRTLRGGVRWSWSGSSASSGDRRSTGVSCSSESSVAQHGRVDHGAWWEQPLERTRSTGCRGRCRLRTSEVAFGMATRATLQAGAERLSAAGAKEIVAVPLFVSSHSSVIEATKFLLGARPDAPPQLALFAKMSHDHGQGSDGVGRKWRRAGSVRGHDSDDACARSPPCRCRHPHVTRARDQSRSTKRSGNRSGDTDRRMRRATSSGSAI